MFLKNLSLLSILIAVGVVVTLFIVILLLKFFCKNSLNIHIKKYIIFIFQIIINGGILFVLYHLDDGYKYVGLLLIISKIKDFINIIIQLVHFRTILGKKEVELSEKETNICCLIPVYAEAVNMVKANLDSLSNQNLPENVNVTLFVICDGLVVGKNNERSLYEELSDIVIFEDNTEYRKDFITWKSQQPNELIAKKGKYNGVNIILSYKKNNSGKKDSLIIGEEEINLMDMEFVYHTDSDTVADKDCLRQLLYSLQNDETLDGVSGLIRTFYNDNDPEDKSWSKMMEKLFCLMQEYQYFHSVILRRLAESCLKSTVCLPGCVNMIRLGEKSEIAITNYAKLPDKNDYIDTITTMQGTDRKYTSLLLKQGAKLCLNVRAVAFTEPPVTYKSFVNQRRRWSSNSFYNSLRILSYKKINKYIRLSSMLDIIRLYTTMFRLLSYFSFFYFIITNRVSWFIYIISTCIVFIPYVYTNIIGMILLPDYKKLFLSFLINITWVWMPLVYSYTIIKMFFTTTDFKWGTENTIVNKEEQLEIIIEDIEQPIEKVETSIISDVEIEEISEEILEVVIR